MIFGLLQDGWHYGYYVRHIAVKRYRPPGVSMRFGTTKQAVAIGVQIVGDWQAESTSLHVATLLSRRARYTICSRDSNRTNAKGASRIG